MFYEVVMELGDAKCFVRNGNQIINVLNFKLYLRN